MSRQDLTRTALAIAVLGALTAAPATFAQSTQSTQATPAKGSAQVSASDRRFIEEAATGGLKEVDLGRLAQRKATHADVKSFGQRMADDHGQANEKLKSLASSKGVTIPSSLDRQSQSDVDKLARSKDFDRDYMALMVKDHKKDVAEFQKQAKSAKDPEVKDFASSTLPTLEEHLKLAENTDRTVKTAQR